MRVHVRHRRVLVMLTAGLLAATSSAAAARPVAAHRGVPKFGITHDLGLGGGEPSIQDDGHGHIYITNPLGTGTVGGTGVKFWRSNNDGASFLPPTLTGGTLLGGSDSDVASDASGHNMWIADLAAAYNNILHSTNSGAAFASQSQAGPESDREWLTPLGKSLILTYHDLAVNNPLIFISNDEGATWSPGGTAGMIFSPSDPGFADTKCNTLVGKPVTDAAGNLYVLTTTSTIAEDLQNGCAAPSPLDRMYVSVSHDGGHTFTSHLASDISSATTGHAHSGIWGNTFNQLAIDAGGNPYIEASGTLDGTGPLRNSLVVSKNHGRTFSKPIVTHRSPDAQLFPAIATGQAGQVAVGYYQGRKPLNTANGSDFQFVIDESFNATSSHPTFTHVVLPPLKGTTPHPDGICTAGIFCGTPLSAGGNRNLADFESMAVDPRGHLEVIIPADCDKCTGTENWFYKQTSGPLLVPGPTNGNGTGNQTPVKGSLS
ncbi:MAG: hypothetical protein ACTHK4_06800 [Mycobacteriales bacterium]